MPWECMNCGNFNGDDVEDECLKCDMEKFEAMNMEVKIKKTQCPECAPTPLANAVPLLHGIRNK